MPAEYQDFALMRGMRWSWEQLKATPWYVQRYCADFLAAIADYESDQMQRQQRQAQQAQG